MKPIRLLVCLMTFGLLILAPQTVVHAAPQYGGPTSLAGPQPSRKPEHTAFVGRINEAADGKYMLEDTSNNRTFMLDNQSEARDFNGKNVKVTGTLAPDNTIIHVIDIEAM